MTIARPMNHQDNLAVFLIYVADNLLNENAHQPLLQTHIGRRCVPNSWKVLRQAQKNLLVRHRRALDLVIERAELVFQFLYFFQTFHRASSSAATNRRSGSTASYRRAASRAS